MAERVLDMENLHVSFDTYAGEVKAVRGVTLHVDEGEVLAIVGESGCGKSVTAQTIMKLNPMPPARIVEGSINLAGHDVVKASEKEMQKIRGKEVAMIFQDPMTCMNPTTQVGKQIVESIKLHRHLSRQEAKEEAVKCLKQVNIPNPEERAKQYPHEFSGGMRQRAMIAELQPEAADRRRADDGAGCDDSGADHGFAGGAEGQDQHRHHPHYARPRRGRGHRRPRRRDVRGQGG